MMPIDPESQLLDRQSLEEMLQRMQELAESGARDAARDMLSQLQEMLENLQMGMMPMDQQGNQAMELLEQLQDLARGQQELLDQTFRQSQPGQEGQPGQQMPGQSGQPMPGQGMDPGEFGSQGAEIQEALRRALGDLMRQMGEMTGDIPAPFGRAEQSMRQSEQALGQGAPGEALGPQTEALDQLQQGMQSLADQLMDQMAQQNGLRPGQYRQNNTTGRDPLGRELPNSGATSTEDVQIPDEADLQRAREIIDELRRRSGERSRPPVELDYIDRLLRQF
jgi:hypothetical protein